MTDYSLTDLLKTAYYLLITKLCFPKARLVRRPIYIRGKKGISYGEGFTTGHGCRLDAVMDKVTMHIGKNARIGDHVHINAMENVTIGDNVLIASKVFISDTSHGSYGGAVHTPPDTNPSERELACNPVFIGDNVWIGENVVILPGSKVGNGCIIGANSVISGKEYKDNSIIVGAPGKVIKQYNPETKKWEKI